MSLEHIALTQQNTNEVAMEKAAIELGYKSDNYYTSAGNMLNHTSTQWASIRMVAFFPQLL